MPISNSMNTPSLNSGIGQTPGSVLVADSSTQIVSSNTSRSSVFLTNTGLDDVWISCDAAALVDKGLIIGAEGGSLLLDRGAFTTGSINGICKDGKESTIIFQELNK